MSAARILPRRGARGRVRLPALRMPGPRVFAALAVCVVLAVGYGWLRESSLVAVETVSITGLTSHESPRIRRALEQTATDMTTLHVRENALRSAVGPFPIVRDLQVDADAPHTLRIHVVEYRPAAVVVSGSDRIAVAADGTLLRGSPAPATLPVVPVKLPPGGGRLADPRDVAAVRILGAAPRELRELSERVVRGAGGARVILRSGPQLIFGSSTRPHAKWAAAARVLADPTTRGASYVDVRVPDRPVAGRFAPNPQPAVEPTL